MKTIIIISFIILQFGQQALAAEKKLSGRLQELGLRFVDHCPAADRAIIQAMNSECTQFLKGSLGEPTCITEKAQSLFFSGECTRLCEATCVYGQTQARERSELQALSQIIKNLKILNDGDWSKISANDRKVVREKLIKVKGAEKVAAMSDQEVLQEAVEAEVNTAFRQRITSIVAKAKA